MREVSWYSRCKRAIKSKTESRRYAKRQMTWARRYMADWEWFPGPAEAIDAIGAQLKSSA